MRRVRCGRGDAAHEVARRGAVARSAPRRAAALAVSGALAVLAATSCSGPRVLPDARVSSSRAVAPSVAPARGALAPGRSAGRPGAAPRAASVSVMERALFDDVAMDGRIDGFEPLDAAFVVGGARDPRELHALMLRARLVEAQVRRAWRTRKPTLGPGSSEDAALADTLLTAMHEQLLSEYVATQSSAADAIRTGRFNCVAATHLFLGLAARLGLDAWGQDAPGHVRALVATDDGLVPVETTAPGGVGGALPPSERARVGLERDTLRVAKVRLAGEAVDATDPTSSRLALPATLAYRYTNDAALEADAGDLPGAWAALAKAARLVPGDDGTVAFRDALVHDLALSRLGAGDAAGAQALARYGLGDGLDGPAPSRAGRRSLSRVAAAAALALLEVAVSARDAAGVAEALDAVVADAVDDEEALVAAAARFHNALVDVAGDVAAGDPGATALVRVLGARLAGPLDPEARMSRLYAGLVARTVAARAARGDDAGALDALQTGRAALRRPGIPPSAASPLDAAEGDLHFEAERWPEAAEAYARALIGDPTASPLHHNLVASQTNTAVQAFNAGDCSAARASVAAAKASLIRARDLAAGGDAPSEPGVLAQIARRCGG